MRKTSLRKNTRQLGWALLVLASSWPAAGGLARAQELHVNTAAVRPAAAPALEIKDKAVQLSVNQAVEVALQQNLAIVLERYTRATNRLALFQSLGLVYDLTSTASLAASNARSAVISTIDAGQENRQSVGFSFGQTLPTGGNLSVGYSAGRTESNAGVRQGVATDFSSGLTFTYTQPLLNDYGRLAVERNILIAQTNSNVSHQQFELQVTTTIQQVVNAYWNLVGTREQLVVAQESLALARELHDRNRIQVEVGTLAPLELVQSEAAIAMREEDIIRATANIGDAEDVLRQLLNLPSGPLWEMPIVPTTPPATERVSIDVERAIETAYAKRPELRNQELRLAQAELDARYFLGQLKPNLNLNADYGYSGVGFTFPNALDQITGLDFPRWSFALRFGYPIQNRVARAQSASATLAVERVQTELEQSKTVIATEVRRATRGVETAAKQIEAARISRQFQEKNLDAEKKRYENGMSTSFQITQIQEDLTQARTNEVAATITYRTALAEYYRAIGGLLAEERIAIDDPADPDWRGQRFSFSRAPLPGGER